MKECSERAGHIINKETVVFDCTNMGWHRKCDLLPKLAYFLEEERKGERNRERH